MTTFIVVDIDDTLLDSFHAKVQGYMVGLNLSENQRCLVAEIHAALPHVSRGDKVRRIVSATRPADLRENSLDQLVTSVSLAMRHELDAFRLVGGAINTLTSLCSNHSLLALSAMPQGELDELLELHGLLSFFTASQGDVGDKASYLAQGHFSPVCFVIGDSPGDLAAADRIGAPFVQVRLRQSTKMLEGARLQLPSLRGLSRIAKKICRCAPRCAE